ncbi:hypothetical protein [Photorhabdus sp. RM323S]|uniref:hypothetical protein n=1 Tax=Photorhabdus sp. RM323S TaxID=3342828 RepID=UPI0036DA0FEC
MTCASDPAACKEKYGELPANSMLVRQAIDKALLLARNLRRNLRHSMVWISSARKSWRVRHWVL